MMHHLLQNNEIIVREYSSGNYLMEKLKSIQYAAARAVTGTLRGGEKVLIGTDCAMN